ncbi:MAG: PEP-CTERM sorting domain-containing protein, partial [Okeania sp. SIO2D1]|nr:PEP-CTERM sorting domain-containing protein [Okeania sp. SIO2D1]
SKSILNVIDTYDELVGDVTFINDFSNLGLDFAGNVAQTGSYTYGFSFDTSNFDYGEFVAHVFAECGNDGIGFTGLVREFPDVEASQEVPEPAALTGLALLGLGLLTRRQNSKRA